MITKVPSHSPILWSQGLVAGARRIAIALFVSCLCQITVKTIHFTPKVGEGGGGGGDAVIFIKPLNPNSSTHSLKFILYNHIQVSLVQSMLI